MTNLRQLRKTALGLPEVEEVPQGSMRDFQVDKRSFITVTSEDIVQLALSARDITHAETAHPSGSRVERNGEAIGFAIALAQINGKDLNDLIRRSWQHKAPKRLNVSETEHSLPSAIGRPATRALVLAGYASLTDIANASQVELLRLHGVGPRAIRILNEHLQEQGFSTL